MNLMPYTTDEGGRLNNFANEPKMYQADPSTPAQKRTFVLLGVGVLTLIVGLVYVAFSVS